MWSVLRLVGADVVVEGLEAGEDLEAHGKLVEDPVLGVEGTDDVVFEIWREVILVTQGAEGEMADRLGEGHQINFHYFRL